ncbi:GrpB family protein [Planomicrobium okeanokoites]|uniref:GrpB family protein n=1 Tax=Planomicrobium okeanokoites TaxID=244 RepID=UPI0024925DEC|nr:GrpB family protein [Planomicrobium okeanokoites]
MIGLPKGKVFLTPWTNEWEKIFLTEKEKIQEELGSNIIDVHHIGSTAIKNLAAKPIIDIAIELNNFKDGELCIASLEKMGYSFKGTDILPDRYYFNKGEPRTHQIHMYESGNQYLLEQLKFRDFLRNNEEARIQYEKLKQHLASVNKTDKHQYATDKTEFVRSILENLEK